LCSACYGQGVKSRRMRLARKNPFTSTDPKLEMIRFVSDQAISSGSPLTDEERRLLASENPDVDQSTEMRLRSLVSAVIASQKASGRDADPRSFTNAIEWVTDMEWPYVAALAVAEITGAQSVEQVARRSESGPWVTAGCVAVMALLIVAVILLVSRMF
jgi:hypothetical protein